MDTQTQAAIVPPHVPPKVATGYGEPDEFIREIGDRIAALTPRQARMLERYLAMLGMKAANSP